MTVDFSYGARRVALARHTARELYASWARVAEETSVEVPGWLRRSLEDDGPFGLQFDASSDGLDEAHRAELFELNESLIVTEARAWARATDQRDRRTVIIYLARLIELQALLAASLGRDPMDLSSVPDLTPRDRAECEAQRIIRWPAPDADPLSTIRSAIELLRSATPAPNELLADLLYREAEALLDADELEGALEAATASAERAESESRRAAANELTEGMRELL